MGTKNGRPKKRKEGEVPNGKTHKGTNIGETWKKKGHPSKVGFTSHLGKTKKDIVSKDRKKIRKKNVHQNKLLTNDEKKGWGSKQRPVTSMGTMVTNGGKEGGRLKLDWGVRTLALYKPVFDMNENNLKTCGPAPRC